MNKFLASLPSTNFRIFVTMGLVALTAFRYTASGSAWGKLHVDSWVPDWEWLVFLAALAGIDLAQFHIKRKSHMEAPPTGPDIEDAKSLKREGMHERATDTIGNDSDATRLGPAQPGHATGDVRGIPPGADPAAGRRDQGDGDVRLRGPLGAGQAEVAAPAVRRPELSGLMLEPALLPDD